MRETAYSHISICQHAKNHITRAETIFPKLCITTKIRALVKIFEILSFKPNFQNNDFKNVVFLY